MENYCLYLLKHLISLYDWPPTFPSIHLPSQVPAAGDMDIPRICRLDEHSLSSTSGLKIKTSIITLFKVPCKECDLHVMVDANVNQDDGQETSSFH